MYTQVITPTLYVCVRWDYSYWDTALYFYTHEIYKQLYNQFRGKMPYHMPNMAACWLDIGTWYCKSATKQE